MPHENTIRILGLSPAPPGMRALYVIFDDEDFEVRIVPVITLAPVIVRNRFDITGVSIDPFSGNSLILCQASPSFVKYLNPGESADDMDTVARRFVENVRKGLCGHCGRIHRRRKKENG